MRRSLVALAATLVACTSALPEGPLMDASEHPSDAGVDSAPPAEAGLGADAETGRGTDAMRDARVPRDGGGTPYDTCTAPLDVSLGGHFDVDVGAAHGDYPEILGPLFCGGVVGDTCRDIVASFHIDDVRDVDVSAFAGDDAYVALSMRASCGPDRAPVDVARGYGRITLRHHSLQPGTYFVFVGADEGEGGVIGGPPPPPFGPLEIDVSFSAPTPVASNDACESPIDVGAGGRFLGSFVDVTHSVAACGSRENPNLIYAIHLGEPSNVRVTLRADAILQVALRESCGPANYADCHLFSTPWRGERNEQRLFYDLSAGTHYLILEDWAHREPDFTLDVAIESATPAPVGDTCAAPLDVTAGVLFAGSLAAMQEDAQSSLGADAYHQFTLTETSDVWVRARSPDGDLSIAVWSTCDESTGTVGGNDWSAGTSDGVSTYVPVLPPGTYRFVVSSYEAESYELVFEAWPSRGPSPVSVALNEDCASAFELPPEGGVFIGDTTAARDDTSPASCGIPAWRGGADVAFTWTNGSSRRVFVSSAGTEFYSAIQLQGLACSDLVCDAWRGGRAGGFLPRSAALDITLPPGRYTFILDGLTPSARGRYRFELRAF